MMHKQDKYSRVRDFYVAAYLFARGGIITGIQVEDGRAVFAFADSPDLSEWRDELRFGTPLIDVRIFICAITVLQRKKYAAFMRHHGED